MHKIFQLLPCILNWNFFIHVLCTNVIFNLTLLYILNFYLFSYHWNKFYSTTNCWTHSKPFNSPKKRRKILLMQIILQTKHHKSQIVVYQLLSIWIKCLMFCKHVSIYFYTSQNNNNQTSTSHEFGFFLEACIQKSKCVHV
jgi:hypothetical protein